VKDAVEPREDLVGHLGHIAVVERVWLSLSRMLIGETVYSLNRVLEAWRLLLMCVLYAILGFDDAQHELHAVNANVNVRAETLGFDSSSVADITTSPSAAPINHNHYISPACH
jgi:hypothetical protein